MEKRTSSSRSASSKASNAKEAALGAAYVCLALALSFLESQIPFDALVPIPGFKLGLANIVICTVFYRHSAKTALLVLICRLALSFILFSNISSFIFSLVGALLSYTSLFISKYILRSRISFIGVSVISAVFHNMGQLAAALLVTGSLSALFYMPYLVLAAVICGGATGVILCFLPRNVFFEKELKSL